MSRNSRRSGIGGNGSKRHYFVEALDGHTRAMFRSRLEGSVFCDDLRCDDGAFHNLWECNQDLAAFFWKHEEDLGLKYSLFVQKGNGPIYRQKDKRVLVKPSYAKILDRIAIV